MHKKYFCLQSSLGFSPTNVFHPNHLSSGWDVAIPLFQRSEPLPYIPSILWRLECRTSDQPARLWESSCIKTALTVLRKCSATRASLDCTEVSTAETGAVHDAHADGTIAKGFLSHLSAWNELESLCSNGNLADSQLSMLMGVGCRHLGHG